MRKNYTVDAIATYICICSIRQGMFIGDVEIEDFSVMLCADEREKTKALKRAYELLPEIQRSETYYGESI